jgi:hypothetical protein
VVIALIVTPDGFPIAYEVLSGNTTDKTTLADFLRKIETQYGKADRIWIMDRGIPTEETLLQMRQSDPPVSYLVGTPKGRLTTLEKPLLDMPWHTARPSVKVKLLARDGETYVLAQSGDRIAKERSMRRRRLRKYLKTLADLTTRKRPLKRSASGLTPRAVLEKFAAVQLLDVHLPTTDGREIVLTRHTQPEKDLQILLHQLQLTLPEQAPPKIQAPAPTSN